MLSQAESPEIGMKIGPSNAAYRNRSLATVSRSAIMGRKKKAAVFCVSTGGSFAVGFNESFL